MWGVEEFNYLVSLSQNFIKPDQYKIQGRQGPQLPVNTAWHDIPQYTTGCIQCVVHMQWAPLQYVSRQTDNQILSVGYSIKKSFPN